MEFRLLGPVMLTHHGDPLELGSIKERIVLASLALEVGRPISLDRLIGRLWDDAPPLHARSTAHSHISRLRGHLRLEETGSRTNRDSDFPGSVPEIVNRSHTYELKAPADSVDWHRFQKLAAAAMGESDNRAVELLFAADALWHGEALAGLPGLWAATVRRSLSELRLTATAFRSAAQLRLGQYAALISELSALVDEHPQNETLLGHLTLAYYGSGRFGESLQVQQNARQMLWKEYGARPGRELDRLHHGILERLPAAQLAQELTQANTGPVKVRLPVPSRTLSTIQSNVPRTLPRQHPLIGRTTELELLTSRDGAPPDGSVILLETVSGMPGVGKTAIAVHTADLLSVRFPEGQIYLDLRAHSPALAPMSIAEALTELLRMLGAPPSAIPIEDTEKVSLWRAMMAERRAIIVLDDAASASQVEPLLPVKSPSLVIITSRRHLTGLIGTRSLTLDTLSADDAVQLFRSFAGKDRTGDTTLVKRVVLQCGLLPLAIELVANRFRTRPSWTVATLSERLSRESGRLAEIRDTNTDVARAFELSYRTLTELQRKAFRWFSLHPGVDFTLDIAAAMLNLTSNATERILEELLARHLLQEPEPDRYRYHDLVREFARQVAESEDQVTTRDLVLARIIRSYVQHTEATVRISYPHRMQLEPQPDKLEVHEPEWLNPNSAKEWLKHERGNLLAVEEHASKSGDPEYAARLGYALAGFLESECHWRDGAAVLQRAVNYWSTHGPAAYHCRALIGLAASYTNIGSYSEADRAGVQALKISGETVDRKARAEALLVMGTLAWSRGETIDALHNYREALAARESLSDQWEISRIHSNIGVTLLFLGDTRQASLHFDQAISGFKSSGDLTSAAKVLNNKGDQYMRDGNLDAARHAFEDSLEFLETAGNRFAQATVRSSLADVLMELGHTQEARQLYQETLYVFRELGDRKSLSESLIGIGESHRAIGEFEQSLIIFNQALETTRLIGAAHQETQALRCLGRVELSLARLETATDHLRSAAATALRIHDLDEIVEAHTLLADVHIAKGDINQARAVLRTAADAVAEHPDHRRAKVINDRLTEMASQSSVLRVESSSNGAQSDEHSG